ncbi:MAG: bifunctional aspartate kinase/homoserine dehydrogenase I [Flavobacteriaceae bacterium]|nr:bifunctional aspartate kinase/homoserine dehydrogenase I [Flavobacteriaceae bacterium]
MKVLKFGGTSVGTANSISSVINIVKGNTDRQVIVVSAFSGVTNALLEGIDKIIKEEKTFKEVSREIVNRHLDVINALIDDTSIKNRVFKYLLSELEKLEQLYKGLALIQELTPKAEAKIVSFGELISSFIIYETMKINDVNIERIDTRKLIVANENYFNATVDFDKTNKIIQQAFENSTADVIIVPGFVAANHQGETVVLGRGGSDFTASIFANALEADVLEIWTDVSGMYTANPKLVKQAKAIDEISYREAMELSHFGAKVIYPPTIHPVLNKIPILIKNTFSPEDKGTLISNTSHKKVNPVKGISHIGNITLITLEGSGMIGVPGISKRLFEALALNAINIKLITQASSEHTICIAINDIDAVRAKTAIDSAFEFEISKGKINPLTSESGLAIIALVGDQMKSHQGISGKMFSTLGKNNVNVRAIAQGASENNISAVISHKDVKKALNSLHEHFFEGNLKQINVFITGVGNVGSKLIHQIKNQQKFLKDQLNLNLRVIGLSNSKKMLFDEGGISLSNWKEKLAVAAEADINMFAKKVNNLNLRNSVFIDITAHEAVAGTYKDYLSNSIGVVACNKIACSDQLEKYNELKLLSKKYNAPFLFETNVGAGLPVIDTLNNLIASGDKINSIHAVLSGSLNFIFNTFDDITTFHDVVKKAQDEGFTEPDPRIDLSGVDVARKILILARESGYQLNLDDIENTSFLTKDNLATDSVSDFYTSLVHDEKHFQDLYQSAKSKNCKLKYVASLAEGKARVSLQEIPSGHPFYNLEGKDNIVMFYTERYPEQPMIVKGAGAGAEVTASGLFADIIRAANY